MKNVWKVLFLILILYMIIHVEIIIHKKYAPESVLIKVRTAEGNPEINAKCHADIFSDQINEENKELKELSTIYEFIDIKKFILDDSKGHYLLETGFSQYDREFEIRIVCYSPSFKGVSYTIINNTHNKCEIKEDGKLVIC